MNLRFALLIALLFASPGFASEPDCQAAFNLLRELGFPDVRGGRLVHIEEANRSHYDRSDQIEDIDGQPQANAWLMESPSNGPAILFDLFGRRFRMISEKAESESPGDERPVSDLVSGTMTSINARAYAVVLTNFLGSIEVVETSNEEQSFFLASTFFLAAGLYQNGFQPEAVAITDRVLANHPDPEAFLSACVGILADAAYEDCMTRFLADGNWADFANRVKHVRRQFGRRWVDDEEAREVEESARQRAEQGSGPVPDGDFPAWAVACIQELLSDKPIDISALDGIRGYPWVLAPSLDPAVSQTQACPIVRLLDGGMASVPILLAIATNPTPLRLSNREPNKRFGPNERGRAIFQRVPRNGNSRHIEFESFSSDPFDTGYGGSSVSLPRPMMLKEIALRFLSVPLPDVSAPGEESLAAVQSWYDAHRKDTRFELARAFLRDEDNSAAYAAMGILMTEGSDSDRQRVEKTILEMADKPEKAFSLAFQYVKYISPDKAASFKTTIVARIRESFARPATNDVDPDLFVEESPDRSRSSQVRMESVMLKAFGKGSQTNGPNDLKTMLDSLAATNTPLSSSVLYTVLRRTDRDRAVVLITNAILRVSFPEQRGQLIGYLAMLRNLEPAGEEAPETVTPSELAPPWRPSAAKTASRAAPSRAREREALPASLSLEALGPLWRVLLTESRPAEWAETRLRTALVMESLYGEDREKGMEARPILGETFDRLLIERNLARLDGRPLPGLPTMQDATGTDRPALEKTLLAIPVAELPAAVSKLEPVAVLALSVGAPVDPVLAARLAAIAGRVGPVPPGLGLQPGKTLATGDVARLVNLLKEAKEPGPISIKIERKPHGRGLTIERIAGLPPASDYQYRYSGRYRMSEMKASAPDAPLLYARVELMIREGRRFGNGGEAVFWFLEEDKTAEAGRKPANLDARLDSRQGQRYSEDNSERFWESVGLFCSATNMPLAPAAIRLYRIPPDDWKKAAGSGGDDEVYFE